MFVDDSIEMAPHVLHRLIGPFHLLRGRREDYGSISNLLFSLFLSKSISRPYLF